MIETYNFTRYFNSPLRKWYGYPNSKPLDFGGKIGYIYKVEINQ